MAELSQGRIFELIREHKAEIIQKIKIEQALAFQRDVTIGTGADVEDFAIKAHGIDYASEVVDRILDQLEGGME